MPLLGWWSSDPRAVKRLNIEQIVAIVIPYNSLTFNSELNHGASPQNVPTHLLIGR
jgi:hypothetical protein